MLRVFTAVVRSLTEYACQAWHTTLTEEQSDKLESIQQRALKIRRVAIALVVACAPVTRRPRVQSPVRADRHVEIYFSPFNIGDCVSLVARMTT